MLRMSGAYVLSEGCAMGFIKHMIDDPNSEERKGGTAGLRVISIVRSAV